MTSVRDMKCQEVIEFLMSYVDGELSPDRRAEFDRHLSQCPSCVRYLETYRQTVRLGLAAMTSDEVAEVEEVPEALIRAVREARKQSPRKA